MSLELQIRIKRLMDLFLAAIGLVVTWPLLLLIAVLIRLDSPGPILFRQLRTGRNGQPFYVLKFRTMYVGVPHLRNPDGSAFVARDDPRVTRVGRWLREFSLDELPQLLNVLRGDMSVIGPRPEKTDYTQDLPDWAREKLRFRPGMLSLSLIRGRNELSWEQRNELDVYYVRNYSLWLDVQILLLGVWTVLVTRRGAYSPVKLSDPKMLYPSITKEETK